MIKCDIDILMITYNRPEYTQLSLERLLATCDENMRVWIWHNGNDEKTLKVVHSFLKHSNIHEFHHSHENKKLRKPINWLWKHSKGMFLTKVDDDCLMPYGWAEVLRKAHFDVPEFGVIGCWRYLDEDFIPELANKKIREFAGGHRLMQNCWIEGSGHLMKRQCLQTNGLLRHRQGFPGYCVELAMKGWINGWYYPFLYQEHMDDPRSIHSYLKTDEDLQKWMPITAQNNKISSLNEWASHFKRSSRYLQEASLNPQDHIWGRRGKLRRAKRRICRKLKFFI